MMNLLGGAMIAPALLGGLATTGFLFFAMAYLVLAYDKRREGSETADDDQIGLKLALYWLQLTALTITATGVSVFLWYILSGTDAGSSAMKSGIAMILAGGGFTALIEFQLVPRTNLSEYPRASRYALGFVAVAYGLVAMGAVTAFLVALFNYEKGMWVAVSMPMGAMLAFGGLAFFALTKFGSTCGWKAPAPRARPAAGFPQQGQPQQGFPQQGQPQQGFPQQGQPQQGFPQQGQPQQGFPQQGQPQQPQQGQPQQGFPQQGDGSGFPGGGQGGGQQGGGGLPPPAR